MKHRVRVVRVLTMIVVFACVGCKQKEDAKSGVQKPARPPPPQLPEPYAEVQLGMSAKKLAKLFPPSEDTSKCASVFIGIGPVAAPQVPGAEKKADSRCPWPKDIAG